VTATFDTLEALHYAEFQPGTVLIVTLPADGTCSGLDVVYTIRRKAPRLPIILIPRESSEMLAIGALRAGVTDYLRPPAGLDELLASVRRCLDDQTPQSGGQAAAARSTMPDPPRMIGRSRSVQSILGSIAKAASTESTALITGETGTGKELVAKLIHYHSGRRSKPLVCINCAAIPDTLLESELFGYERGAFTGAHTSQAGRFELANGGTVFLDEIGELPLELQPKILRVLQEGQVERLGAGRTTRVDVRVVTATNRNLNEEVRSGRFRRDLFYRLNVFPITLPTLRERRDDLPALVRYLVDRLGRDLGKPIVHITPGTYQALERYDWPGNIRELENVLQQAIIVSHEGVLDLSAFVGESMQVETSPRTPPNGSRSLVDVERDHIQLVLETVGWRIEGVAGAAQVLGLRPSTLRTRMRKLGIQRPPKPQALQT
jgi:DNA-binding NtrC family response regulator